MSKKGPRTHAGKLEKSRIALDKAETNPRIARAMKKHGYGPEVLKEGKDLLESTREIYDENLQIQDEQSLARSTFSKHKKEMDSEFREHREKAKHLFHKDVDVVDKLGLKGKYPTIYVKWRDYMRAFYSVIVESSEIQQRFKRLNFTKDDAEAGLDNVHKLDHLRAKWINEKGISQNSTQQKNKAFAELNEWMSVFYGVAKMALKNEPELLEILYKSA
ncbi:MAG: hypothetical protein PF450_00445 [Bacteroidales bacterium]|jgi:hypothetical protein|nr:hypothetical protein [Bacteroidales bacterium]